MNCVRTISFNTFDYYISEGRMIYLIPLTKNVFMLHSNKNSTKVCKYRHIMSVIKRRTFFVTSLSQDKETAEKWRGPN